MPGTSKSTKKSRIVTLILSPDALAQFPSSSSSSQNIPSSASSAAGNKKPEAASTPVLPAEASSAADKSSDTNATPAPMNGDGQDSNTLAPPSKGDAKKKRGGAAVAGRKRAPPVIDPSAPPRERGRPGPKKKPRLPDGTIDRSGDGGKIIAGAVPAHKLGPKANTGAINAGLRALDRSGKPCRRWERKGLSLKSFTGTVWNMSSWKGHHVPNLNADGEVKSDSSSDVKLPDTSAVASEQSQSGIEPGENTLMNGIESSPVPPAAA